MLLIFSTTSFGVYWLFIRYSAAPSESAFNPASSPADKLVRTITGMSLRRRSCFISRKTSKPFFSGIMMSRRTRRGSGSASRNTRSASLPFCAMVKEKPFSRKTRSYIRVMRGSSSMRKISSICSKLYHTGQGERENKRTPFFFLAFLKPYRSFHVFNQKF